MFRHVEIKIRRKREKMGKKRKKMKEKKRKEKKRETREGESKQKRVRNGSQRMRREGKLCKTPMSSWSFACVVAKWRIAKIGDFGCRALCPIR